MLRLLLPLLLCAAWLHAAHVRWYADYDTAHAQAVKEQKPMMVLLIERNTEASNAMLRDTLANQPYVEWINRHFVSAVITSGTPQSYPIELLYTVTYPALFFLTTEELFLADPLLGRTDAETLRKYLAELTRLVEKRE